MRHSPRRQQVWMECRPRIAGEGVVPSGRRDDRGLIEVSTQDSRAVDRLEQRIQLRALKTKVPVGVRPVAIAICRQVHVGYSIDDEYPLPRAVDCLQRAKHRTARRRSHTAKRLIRHGFYRRAGEGGKAAPCGAMERGQGSGDEPQLPVCPELLETHNVHSGLFQPRAHIGEANTERRKPAGGNPAGVERDDRSIRGRQGGL